MLLVFYSLVTVSMLACSPEENQSMDSSTTGPKTPTKNDFSIWEDDVRMISDSDKTKTEKAAKVEQLVKDTSFTNESIDNFASDTINSFLDKSYLGSTDNDFLMLSRIYKSYAVEQNRMNSVLGDFAFDYYQNVKYVYRGVDDINSESVRANEEQMNKSLQVINEFVEMQSS